mmetsp:Transcript_26836/g.75887  ORF Transcript_26836/g.75887 Transcript_26836/m.75887 type:complete len:219 (-) Transcript_26836:2006-2662(-)
MLPEPGRDAGGPHRHDWRGLALQPGQRRLHRYRRLPQHGRPDPVGHVRPQRVRGLGPVQLLHLHLHPDRSGRQRGAMSRKHRLRPRRRAAQRGRPDAGVLRQRRRLAHRRDRDLPAVQRRAVPTAAPHARAPDHWHADPREHGAPEGVLSPGIRPEPIPALVQARPSAGAEGALDSHGSPVPRVPRYQLGEEGVPAGPRPGHGPLPRPPAGHRGQAVA